MEPVSPIMLLRDLSRDRSNWTDVRQFNLMTQTEIARVLRISQSAVSEYLKPVDLARPDDYPEDDEL